MSCTAATFSGVTAYDRRAFARSDRRVAVARAMFIGSGTVTAAGLLSGAVMATAAWLIAVSSGSTLHQVRTPLALNTAALTQPADRLIGKVIAGLEPARSIYPVPFAPPPVDERGKGPRLRAPFYRQVVAAADTASPLPQSAQAAASPVASTPDAEVAPSQLASAQDAAITASPADAADAPSLVVALNLFDPEPLTGSMLAAAPVSAALHVAHREPDVDAPPLAPQHAAKRADAAPPSSHAADHPQTPAPRVAAAAPAKPKLLQVADATGSIGDAASRDAFEKLLNPPPKRDVVTAPPGGDSRTAIYDIEAHTVYLPDGSKLEAHSGLGERIDDPRYVREKARGPTPPNVYDLALREELFHGVRAIRLNPVDDAKMYGRDGILAHPYMLGSSGQSFGCVSFKDYEAFLKAFERGEVDRMVVVTHLAGAPAEEAEAHRKDAAAGALSYR
jgi:hypothetical protein